MTWDDNAKHSSHQRADRQEREDEPHGLWGTRSVGPVHVVGRPTLCDACGALIDPLTGACRC